MSSKPFSLGRGLSTLIPNKKAAVPPQTDAPAAAAPKTDAVPELGRIHDVAIGQIAPNPRQPRRHFDHAELESLMLSIREHGIVQPLVARALPDGKYELIAGERRLRASQMLGLTSVPVILRETKDDREKLVVALVENINRENLNAIDEAEAYAQLAEEFNLTQDEIAKRVGKSRPTVANMMRLLKLPDDIKKSIIEGRISTAQAKVLAGIEDPRAQQQMFGAILSGGVTVRAAEAAAKGAKESVSFPNAQIASDAEELRKKLGTKVAITGNGSKGSIRIAYYSPEEYRDLLKKLGIR